MRESNPGPRGVMSSHQTSLGRPSCVNPHKHLGTNLIGRALSTWLVRDWEVADAEAEAEDAAEALSWLEEEALISEAALEQKQT